MVKRYVAALPDPSKAGASVRVGERATKADAVRLLCDGYGISEKAAEEFIAEEETPETPEKIWCTDFTVRLISKAPLMSSDDWGVVDLEEAIDHVLNHEGMVKIRAPLHSTHLVSPRVIAETIKGMDGVNSAHYLKYRGELPMTYLYGEVVLGVIFRSDGVDSLNELASKVQYSLHELSTLKDFHVGDVEGALYGVYCVKIRVLLQGEADMSQYVTWTETLKCYEWLLFVRDLGYKSVDLATYTVGDLCKNTHPALRF
jgi:hypothetical protein